MGEPALEWLHLFEATKNRTLLWIMAGGSLSIITYHHSVLPVDSPLVARFLPFASLTDIVIDTECSPDLAYQNSQTKRWDV